MKKKNLYCLTASIAAIAACGSTPDSENAFITPPVTPGGGGEEETTDPGTGEPSEPIVVEPVTASRPNIIVILVDDMGYSDIGCYGSEISTPNIDRLAAQGIRYRTFYNAARSAPARASLLTGLYPHEAGYGALEVLDQDHYRGYIEDNTCTIPEALREVGYTSFVTGKWHLNFAKSAPLSRGFDHSVAFMGGWYWSDDDTNTPSAPLYYEDRKLNSPQTDLLPKGTDAWYTSDMFVTMGLQWMDEALEADKPFFWYMPFNAVHFPIQAKPETINKYKGRYSAGYTEVRKQRFAKQISLGLFKEGELTPENPHKSFKHWDQLSAAEKEKADLRMAIYAACLEDMDTNIGRILAHLDEKGIRDSTLIFFLSDNGGNAETGWPGRWEGSNPGLSGSKIWLGAPWAGVANTPFFQYKHHAHNGGCCTPLILSWTGGINQALWGSIDKSNYGHLVDIMPTILELTGATYPTQRSAKGTVFPVQPMEGISLVPTMSGRVLARTKPIIVEHEGNKMLRDGDWKIVQEFETVEDINNTTANRWRLYNVAEDPTEMKDLSAQYPERLQSMLQTYRSEAERTFVDSSIDWTGRVGNWYSPVRSYGQ